MNTTDRGRIAALTRHSRGGTKEAMKPASAGFRAKFEREVDPEGVLEPEELAVRTDRLIRAHMIKLAARSAEARRKGAQK